MNKKNIDIVEQTKIFSETARTKLFEFDKIFKDNAKKSIDKTELFLQQLKNEGFTDKEIKKASIDIFNKFIGLKCPLEENAENKKVIRNKGDLENFVYEYFFDKNILIIKEVEYVV